MLTCADLHLCPPAVSSMPTYPWMASRQQLEPRPCVAMTTACLDPAPQSSSALHTHPWRPVLAVMWVSEGLWRCGYRGPWSGGGVVSVAECVQGKVVR